MHYLNSVLTPTQRGGYCLSFPKYKDTGIWRVEALASGKWQGHWECEPGLTTEIGPPKCLVTIMFAAPSVLPVRRRDLSPSSPHTEGCHTPSGLSADFRPQRAGTCLTPRCPHQGSSLLLSSFFLPSSLSPCH